MNKFCIAVILGLAAVPAAAVPPEGADPAYSAWYRGLKVPDNGTAMAKMGCCDLADCREVQYRMAGTHYEAFVDSTTFPNGPNKWMTVPDEVVLTPKDNPTGQAVLCLYMGAIRCFVAASGT